MPNPSRKPTIWKISHGSQEFDGESDLRDFLSSRHLVTMNRQTAKGQGPRFESEVKSGDLFFLRETGRIKLLGKIEQDDYSTPQEVNSRFGTEDDWIAKRYSVISEVRLDEPYKRKPMRNWTPNFNSTLAAVKESQLTEFEDWILKPYFGLSLSDLSSFGFSFRTDPFLFHHSKAESDILLNTILYGPPGTGKTYNTADYAVSIIEGKSVDDIQQESHDAVHKRFLDYKEQGRIAFTTFHQSYSYEDFIEGIRPDVGGDADIEYEIHDGSFKEFCRRARPKTGTSFDEAYDRMISDLSEKEGLTEIQTPTGKSFRIGVNSRGNLSLYTGFGDKQQGVLTKEYLFRLLSGDDSIEFRKGYYAGVLDLLRNQYGLSSNNILLESHPETGIPSSSLSPTGKDPHVFVIDEINRGNISKIFGELITLVEPSKRLGAAEETKVKLPYSGDDFGVPSNVYILGTMNTADRSIALLDTALRRRFKFVEMMPRPELLRNIHVAGEDGKDAGIDLEKLLATINDRIEFLLDREHTIGHAYFMGDFKDKPTLAGLADLFRSRIVPLLQEYFFDDYSKIRLVLGDNGKKNDAVQFVNEKKSDGVFFGNAEDAVDPDRCIYRINEAAFGNAAAYIGIYDNGKTA